MNQKTISSEETQEFAEKFAHRLKPGIICLYGELGAGKTTFVRGLARGLGIRSKISSPTFTYQRIHKGRLNLYHFDCYRLKGQDTLMLEDFREIMERDDGVIAVEWAERIEKFLPKNRTEIYFEHVDENTRKIRIRKFKHANMLIR